MTAVRFRLTTHQRSHTQLARRSCLLTECALLGARLAAGSPRLAPCRDELLPPPPSSAAAVLAAGCGGLGRQLGSDATPATATWADGLCSAISTWKTSITAIGDTLKDGDLSKDSLTSAVDDAKSATDTLTSDLAEPRQARHRRRPAGQGVGRPALDRPPGGRDDDRGRGRRRLRRQRRRQRRVGDQQHARRRWARRSRRQISDFEDLDAKGELETRLQQSSSCDELTSRRRDDRVKDDSTRIELMAIPIVAVLFGIGLVLLLAAVSGALGLASRRARRVRARSCSSWSGSSRRHPHPRGSDAPPAAGVRRTVGRRGGRRLSRARDRGRELRRPVVSGDSSPTTPPAARSRRS